MAKQENENDKEPRPQPRKPENTAFKQQRLKSWQPILTPKTVLPSLFILGAVFAPLGGIILSYSNMVSEVSIDYTDCYKHDKITPIADSDYSMTFPAASSIKRPSYRSEITPLANHPNNLKVPKCFIKFSIPVPLDPPIYLYYELSNFHQNHRSYVKSVSIPQLRGDAGLDKDSLDTCKPLKGETLDGKFIPYYPCGLIANSVFNDTISNFYIPDTDSLVYTFSDKNISLKVDQDLYVNNPYDLDKILPPPFWKINYPNGRYTKEYPPPDISKDHHFQVWMRIAGQSTFRKFYGSNVEKKMSAGTYEVQIHMNYNISEYGGRKKLVITNSGPFGKNHFIGFLYIAMAVTSILLGITFTARYFFNPRKLGDHTYLSWNQNPGQAEHL